MFNVVQYREDFDLGSISGLGEYTVFLGNPAGRRREADEGCFILGWRDPPTRRSGNRMVAFAEIMGGTLLDDGECRVADFDDERMEVCDVAEGTDRDEYSFWLTAWALREGHTLVKIYDQPGSDYYLLVVWQDPPQGVLDLAEAHGRTVSHRLRESHYDEED